MVVGFYGALLALLYGRLTLNVIKQRRRHGVSLGDGGVDEVQQAVSAHNNLGQYTPVFLILLLVLELQQLSWILLHIFGVAFIIGRLLHADAIIKIKAKRRVLGMQLTLFSITGLAIVNVAAYGYRLIV